MAYIGNIPGETFSTPAKQSFTPDSSTVSFSLNQSVTNENQIELFINNVRQEPGSGKAYTAAGGTLTMTAAPTTGDEMYCIFQGKAVGLITPPDNTISGAKINSIFDISGKTVTLPDNTISGAKINSTFDISSKTVTLPAASVTAHVNLTYTNGTATGDASTVAFTITAGRAVADVLVHVNGILMTPTTDYTISSTTLTFVTAPAASAEIDFRYLPK